MQSASRADKVNNLPNEIILKIVYFILQSTQKFIKNIRMAYLHQGPISEAHVSIPNGSSSGADNLKR
jgi:hypothetical protein